MHGQHGAGARQVESDEARHAPVNVEQLATSFCLAIIVPHRQPLGHVRTLALFLLGQPPFPRLFPLPRRYPRPLAVLELPFPLEEDPFEAAVFPLGAFALPLGVVEDRFRFGLGVGGPVG